MPRSISSQTQKISQNPPHPSHQKLHPVSPELFPALNIQRLGVSSAASPRNRMNCARPSGTAGSEAARNYHRPRRRCLRKKGGRGATPASPSTKVRAAIYTRGPGEGLPINFARASFFRSPEKGGLAGRHSGGKKRDRRVAKSDKRAPGSRWLCV